MYWNFPDLTALIWFAAFGLLCAGLTVIGGIGWLIWFAIHHVQIV